MGELKEPTEKREVEGEGTKYIKRMRALQNHAEELRGKRKQMERFKVGDRVWSFYFGIGTVTEVQTSQPSYQVQVRWGEHAKYPGLYEYFLLDGRWCDDPDDEEKSIAISEGDDAVNPSHYRVKGIPEAIEIMEGLMTKEQFEGFLWGNILKYAYRYGRKGDKAETAGKIGWYANKLKEVCAEKKEQE